MRVDLAWYVVIPGKVVIILRDPNPRPTPVVWCYSRVRLPPPIQPHPWELNSGKWILLRLELGDLHRHSVMFW